jgi:hypothetical protein
VSDETEPRQGVRIGYIILAHKQPVQVARLVSRLDGDGAAFFIHVDRRAEDEVYREFRRRLVPFSSVRFVRRHRSRWGEFGLVRATLQGISEALESRPPLDYLVLLTGQDYPIKSSGEIRSFLERADGRSFVDCNRVPCEAWPQAAIRLRSWYARILGEQVLLPRRGSFRSVLRRPRRWPVYLISQCLPEQRRPLEGYEPFTGSASWVLSRAAAQYVCEFVRRNPSFVRYFRRVFCPDEIFFQTVLANLPLWDDIVPSNLHYIDWSKGGAHPAIVTSGDLHALADSPALFARKFDPDVDGDVLDLIDERLLGVECGVCPGRPVPASRGAC